MKKEGYDLDYSTSVNIISATTGLIIPPSNILIINSLASGRGIHRGDVSGWLFFWDFDRPFLYDRCRFERL
jgi:TRAP-type C4-dicarboxylate transport system permease large subunit